MTMYEEYTQDESAQLTIFLQELRSQQMTGAGGGEITFGENDQTSILPSSASWARATFSEGKLDHMVYVRPAAFKDHISEVQSFMYILDQPDGQCFLQVSEKIKEDGVLETETKYIQDSTDVLDEILTFFDDSIALNDYEVSPKNQTREVDLVKTADRTKTKLGTACLSGASMLYKSFWFFVTTKPPKLF